MGSVLRPKPRKILSKANLFQAWDASRDATSSPGSVGIDNQTAKQFASNLDANLDEIRKRLNNGSFGFSRLRPFFAQKHGSTKERVICIPTVRDRIVQRAIVNYLATSKILPIHNASSFGFIKGQGTSKAIEKAVELRSMYEWCVKADIESFFDQIPRPFLKERVAAALQNHSLTPLICSAVDCEIKGTNDEIARAAAQGIKCGLGIRQGMPLSPLLANLTLSKFDRAVERRRIPMIRYADDLLLFFDTEAEAKAGQEFVEAQLKSIHLRLSSTKTVVFGPGQNVPFLGLEIAFYDRLSKYVARISRRQIRKIQDRIESAYSYSEVAKAPNTLGEVTVRLSRSISAYLGVYRNAHNYPALLAELEQTMRVVLINLYSDIFGVQACEELDERARLFLGMGTVTMPSAARDLDW
ncbi:reverse transcriptase domain-containing protein [Bradyrhizobium brasilense]|uniref:reverse transcriptase domain-containing protein n=1 Tax=Bradyrhizobium brasilense TaxID=1419277 RepID=UPI00145792E4